MISDSRSKVPFGTHLQRFEDAIELLSELGQRIGGPTGFLGSSSTQLGNFGDSFNGQHNVSRQLQLQFDAPFTTIIHSIIVALFLIYSSRRKARGGARVVPLTRGLHCLC